MYVYIYIFLYIFPLSVLSQLSRDNFLNCYFHRPGNTFTVFSVAAANRVYCPITIKHL